MSKIFIFESGTTGWGGSFKSCYYLAKILKKNFYSVKIGCLNESEYWQKLHSEGIFAAAFYHRFYSVEIKDYFLNKILRRVDKCAKKILYCPLFFDKLLHYKFISKISEFIIEQDIKLVHTNTNFLRDKEVFLVAKENNIPIVCHLRKDSYRRLTLTERMLAKYKKAHFIAISKSIKENWIKAGLPDKNIHVIYNAQPKLSNYITESEKTKGDYVRLLYIGRLTKIKGVDVLIKALEKIDKKLWRLSVVGDGPGKLSLKKIIKSKRLSEKIDFFGYQEEVGKFYSSHDILIVPSIKEPFGRVIIEAMQFSIPVVASNVDGPSEIIENGKNGLLFEAGNNDELSKSIKFLIENPQKRIEIGKAGEERQNFFSETMFAKELLNIYDNLL